jgi:hypothetical protein
VAFTERTASAGREKVAIAVINRDARTMSVSDTGRSATAVYDGITILLIVRALGLVIEFACFCFFYSAIDRVVLRSVRPTATLPCVMRFDFGIPKSTYS